MPNVNWLVRNNIICNLTKRVYNNYWNNVYFNNSICISIYVYVIDPRYHNNQVMGHNVSEIGETEFQLNVINNKIEKRILCETNVFKLQQICFRSMQICSAAASMLMNSHLNFAFVVFYYINPARTILHFHFKML